jgi:hypothetical protein
MAFPASSIAICLFVKPNIAPVLLVLLVMFCISFLLFDFGRINLSVRMTSGGGRL